MTYALRTKLTVKTTNIICAPPALATLTISLIAFRALFRLARIGVMPKLTDREADYRCLSPLRRKTSELEVLFLCRLVSRHLRDRRQNVICFP
jgi:hypothetical protein